MPNIQFIAAGELETAFSELWTDVPFANADAPVSGVSGAHGKVYSTATWPVARVAFTGSPIVTVRTRFRFTTSSDNQPFMQLLDGATEQLQMVYRSTGAIEVKRGSTVLATSATGLFSVNTHYELEWRARISNGGGSVAVNRNGDQIICLPSGLDTQQSSNGRVSHWAVGSDELGAQFDDCVVDTSGEYLGLGEVETLMPNGVGDLTQLSPDTLAANYSRVSQKPHDGETSYVESNGDETDTYEFEDRALAGTPLAVMLSCQPRLQPSVGDPGLRLVCRIDGENYESPPFTGITSTFRQMRFYAWSVNPATNEPWTDEAIDDAEWGVHCLATGIVITQVGLQIYVKTAESDQCLGTGAARDYCASVNEDLN